MVVFYRSDENFDTTGTDTTPVTIPVNTPDKDIRVRLFLCASMPLRRANKLMQACGMKKQSTFSESISEADVGDRRTPVDSS